VQVKLLSQLRHPFIVAYHESFLEKDALFIIMHYCEGGDLASRIRKQNGEHFSEEVSRVCLAS
jgi:NIMA (never in mitosis gene a)-related kinase